MLALDFDGVICDSAGETGEAGWRAAREIWPDIAPWSDEMRDSFCAVRPVLHTGWQGILLVRLLSNGMTPAAILADDQGDAATALMQTEGLRSTDLIQRFAEARDQWISSDRVGWLAAHGSFLGIVEAVAAFLESNQGSVVIITTKQQRFTCSLLERFGLQIPAASVYGLEAGPKAQVLAGLKDAHPGEQLVFVEDRLATLLEPTIVDDDGITRIFAEWGYCTASDVARARRHPRIESCDLPCFIESLRSASFSP